VPSLVSVREESSKGLVPITRVSEYDGESVVSVAATQLGTAFTRTDATRIAQEWIDFLSAGPSAIVELHFVTRTPKRLFSALAEQSQLQRLFVKWGDYDDVAPLCGMHDLRVLSLGGASSIADIEPLAALGGLTHLEIESIRRVHDLSAIGRLRSLRVLELGGNWMASRRAHIDTIGWISELDELEHLLLHTMVVDDLDYTPLLQLPGLEAVRVMAVRRMHPPVEELQRLLPWSA
jgi:hypothetical protein